MAYSQKTQIVERNFQTISPIKFDEDQRAVKRAKNVQFFGGSIVQRDSLQPVQFMPLRAERIELYARDKDNFIVYLKDVDLSKLRGSYNIVCRENGNDYNYLFRVVEEVAAYAPNSQVTLSGPSVISQYDNNSLVLSGLLFSNWSVTTSVSVSVADAEVVETVNVLGSPDYHEIEIPVTKAFPLVSIFKVTNQSQELVQPHKIFYLGDKIRILVHSLVDATFKVALAYPEKVSFAESNDWFLSFAEIFSDSAFIEKPVVTVYGLKNNTYEVILNDITVNEEGLVNASFFADYSSFAISVKKSKVLNRLFVSTYREPVLVDQILTGVSTQGWFFYGLLPSEHNAQVSNICTLDKRLVILTNQGVYTLDSDNQQIIQSYALVNSTSIVDNVFGGNSFVSFSTDTANVIKIEQLNNGLFSVSFELTGVLSGNLTHLIGLPVKFDDKDGVIYDAQLDAGKLYIKVSTEANCSLIKQHQVFRINSSVGRLFINPNLVSINDHILYEDREFLVIQKEGNAVIVVGEPHVFLYGSTVEIIRNAYMEMSLSNRVIIADEETRVLGGTYFNIDSTEIIIDNFNGVMLKQGIHEYVKEGDRFYFSGLYFLEPMVVSKVLKHKVFFTSKFLPKYSGTHDVKFLKVFLGDKFPVGRVLTNSGMLRYLMSEDLADIIDGQQPIGILRDGNFLAPIVKVLGNYYLERLKDIDFVVAASAQKGFGVITNDRKFDFVDKQGYALKLAKNTEVVAGWLLSVFTSAGVHCGYYGVTAVDNGDPNFTWVTLTPLDEKISIPSSGYVRPAFRLEYYARVRSVLSSEIVLKHQKINLLADYENSRIVFHLRRKQTFGAYFVDFLRAALNTQNYYLVGTVEPEFSPFFIDVLTDSALVTTDQKTLELLGDISGENAYLENARSLFTNFGFTDSLSLDGQFYANILLPHNIKVAPVSLNNPISSFSMNINFGTAAYSLIMQNTPTHDDVTINIDNVGAAILTRAGSADFDLPTGATEINVFVEFVNNTDKPVFLSGLYRASVVDSTTLRVTLVYFTDYLNQNLGTYKVYIAPTNEIRFPVRARTSRGFYVSDSVNLLYRLEECINFIDTVDQLVDTFANYDIYNGNALGIFAYSEFGLSVVSSAQFFLNDRASNAATARRSNLNRLHISAKGQHGICLAENPFNTSFLPLADEPVRIVPFLSDSITSSARNESVILVLGKNSISAANARDIMYGRKNLLRVSELGIDDKRQVASGQYLFIVSQGDIYFFDKSFRATKITERIFESSVPGCACAQFGNKTFLANGNDIAVAELTDRGLIVSNMNVSDLYKFGKNLNEIKTLMNQQFFIFENFIAFRSRQKNDAGFFIASLIEFHEKFFGFYDVFDFYFIDVEYGKTSGDLYLYVNKDCSDAFDLKAKAEKEFSVKSHTFVYTSRQKVVERFMFEDTAMQSLVPMILFRGEGFNLKGISICVRANNPAR